MQGTSKPELSIDPQDQLDLIQSKGSLYRHHNRTLSMSNSIKMAKSNEFFKKTRVDSCSFVVVKNGVAQAIPYRPKAKFIDTTHFYFPSENQ